jgi:putative membrane protein
MVITSLSTEQRAHIHAVVVATEARTSARFILIVVPASDRYALFPVFWAAVVALSATGLLALLRPTISIGDGFLVDAALFIAVGLALDWWPLRLRIVPGPIKRHYARKLARHEFATRILGSAVHRDGILFFVSLGERYVEVIGSREIHNRVAPGVWAKLVADFVAAVKGDHLSEGFVAAIEACGAILEKHHPGSDTKPNAASSAS